MKCMIFLPIFFLSQLSFGASRNDAQQLYSSRGENPAKALQAADIYLSLFAQATTDEEKSELKRLESEAIYFYALKLDNKDAKLQYHERGYEAAALAASFIEERKGVAKKPEWRDELADAYYLYSANMGKYGEAKGVLSSLSRWSRELKPHLTYIMNLGPEAVANRDYGAHRIMGRAFIKVPFESSEEGLKLLQEANEKTVQKFVIDGEEIEVSRHVNNLVFYLEGLRKLGSDDGKFCFLYEKAEFLHDLSEDPEMLRQYNPNLIPETQTELNNFFGDEDNTDYYDDRC